MTTQRKVKFNTASNWSSRNPLLKAGVIGMERDTGLFKIGDGNTRWSNLSYTNNIIDSVTKNIWLSFSGLKAPPTQSATFVDHGVGGAWEFSDAADDTVAFNLNAPTDMDKDVAPDITLKWSSPSTTGNAVWQLEYLWRNPGEDTTGSAEGTLSITVGPAGSANGLVRSTFTGLNAPSSNDKFLHCRLRRLGTDGNDDLGNTAELHGIYMEYTADKLGA